MLDRPTERPGQDSAPKLAEDLPQADQREGSPPASAALRGPPHTPDRAESLDRQDQPAQADQKPRPAEDETASDDAALSEQDGMWTRLKRHPIATGLFILILIAAVVGGIFWYLHARHYESTDDAFIDARPVSISPEVTGTIVDVPVTDNQIVKPGDLLAKIDDRDYRASVEQAAAQIEQAQASIENYQAQIAAQTAQVDQARQQVAEAQAALNFARDQNARAQKLVQSGYGTVQSAQQTASDLQSKEASLGGARSAAIAAERQVAVLKAQQRSAQAQLNGAKAQQATADANLSRTELRATVEGRVTRLTAALGQVATQAAALMVLVPLDVWVTANFKETQLADMKIGQTVDITIDAYGKTFPGRVTSLQSGSGTAFSLLPAENATGNYVKVIQRIPVKISFEKRPDLNLGPGMSVVPTVTVR